MKINKKVKRIIFAIVGVIIVVLLAIAYNTGILQCCIAVIYESKNNYAEAAKWYEEAVEKNFKDLTIYKKLGSMYLNGKGVKKDYSKAYKWIRKAAEAGDFESKIVLASMYSSGKGVNKDPEQSKKWFKAATDGLADKEKKEKLREFGYEID